jgi:hypothetical protein
MRTINSFLGLTYLPKITLHASCCKHERNALYASWNYELTIGGDWHIPDAKIISKLSVGVTVAKHQRMRQINLTLALGEERI